MGVRAVLAVLAAMLTLAAPAHAGGLGAAVSYLESRQTESGGFAEPGRSPDPSLTAWAVLGLAAAGSPPSRAAAYFAGQPYPAATDLALRILALDALGRDTGTLVRQLEGLRRSNGSIGPLVNSTIWGTIALRAAGRPVPSETVRYLRRAQSADGGWGWRRGIASDADDTAAAIQALRAAGVAPGSTTIRRGLAFLRARQNPDGGFESAEGRGSNVQTTAWAIQAYLAAGRAAPAGARAFLLRLQRSDGSFRYSARYVTTPVWVTAYAVAALAGRSYPLD
jgi:energy-coupling factor transport system substrate-specific component